MKVTVTGATGFTGAYTVALLLQKNIKVRCLVRRSSDICVLPNNSVELVYGDLNEPETLERAFEGVHALVNIASLGFGHAFNIVQAAARKEVQRVLFISTTAIFTHLNASTKSIRLAAEEIIRNSNLDYTILRPTMIYGSPKDRNICRLIRYLAKFSIIPVFGSGNYLQQPVHVEDVSRAIKDALFADATIHKSYNIAGAEPITFNQMIEIVGSLLQRKIYRIHLPASPIVQGFNLLEKFRIPFPIKAEQVMRLNENKNFEYSKASQDFGYRPLSFSEGVHKEIMGMRKAGLI